MRLKVGQITTLATVIAALASCSKDSSGAMPLAAGSANSAAENLESEQQTHCVSHHLREAIALNTERMEKYATVSEGRSIPISRKLIAVERATLLLLPKLELPALFYQRRGVPLLCLDVISMQNAPSFLDRVAPPSESYAPSSGREIRNRLTPLYNSGNLVALENALEGELEKLQATPSYHCLTRHLLESILRSARLEPIYIQMSKDRGLPPPSLITKTFIRSQILQLGQAAEIDDAAAILQSEGIPIICRDVPPIPTEVP